MENAPLAVDPASTDDLGGVLAATFKKMAQKIDGSLPAVVVSYDRARNRATVRPLIAVLSTLGDVTQRAQIASVPVLALGGAGFVINFPLKPGDTGWIKANDRDISLYMQSSREAQPNTNRIHSFDDGHFIPDVMAKATHAYEDENKMVIQSYDGATKITMSPDEVQIKSANVKVVAANIEMVGDIEHQGAFNNTGGVTIDGIPFGTHKHIGVQPGTGQTGVPTA